ncbi:hypothetical protein OROMI_018583 [Orobanche minor]
MEPTLYSVNKITPDMRKWSAKVCVVNKTCPRTSSQATPIIFQKLLLSDEQGNKVEAMLYRADVDLLKNCLKLNETYLISNAVVRPVNPAFKNPLVDNNYQGIISAKTAILPSEEKVFVSSTLAPVFTCYDHFHRLLGTTALISTMAVIIGKHEPRSVLSRGRENTLREYVAIDEAFKPFVITFWNDAIPEDIYNLLDSVEHQHVIAALNFRVTNYHDDLPYVLASFKSRLEQMLLKIEIQSKIFNKQDGTAILSYTIHSLECQNITPLPAPANESHVPPSSSGTTYLTTNNINNSIENPTSSPQTLAAYSQSNADAPKSSRGRTLKAKIFP